MCIKEGSTVILLPQWINHRPTNENNMKTLFKKVVATFVYTLGLTFILPTYARDAAQDADRAARLEAKGEREAARAERLAAKENAKTSHPDGASDDSEDENNSETSVAANGLGRMLNVPLRSGATFQVFWIPKAGATATVMLMPGGDGSIGRVVNGQPTGHNFLVRSRELFAERGFNVALVGRPSDVQDLSLKYRTTSAHLDDLKTIIEAIKREAPVPVWMVGTSRGTVSSTAAAIAYGKEELAGIVLTSSLLSSKKSGYIPGQRLSRIQIPVLVVHHAHDECEWCRPSEAVNIIRGLDNAPIKKLIMADGGKNPRGNPCSGGHNHGYMGMEKEVVDIIATWIKKPIS